MKKYLLILFFIPLLSNAQNLPACDSLVIYCCTFDTLGPNTFTIYASNYSQTELFDYPGFVLFNPAMDTIAKETVNYFGIGQGPQPHTLQIVAPLVLPFQGYLNLYKLFYVELACSFPFEIPDTANGVGDLNKNLALKIYPNPAMEEVQMEFSQFASGKNFSLSVSDVMGNVVEEKSVSASVFSFPVHNLATGVYLVRVTDEKKSVTGQQKLIVAR